MIIALVYSKDRSSRMPIYVWDELYFFKGSYSIRIMQWSREVIHRKCLFKEINMLLQERSTFKDTCLTDRQRENCFLTEVESKFLLDFRTDMPKTSSDRLDFFPVRFEGLAYFDMSACAIRVYHH
jgi:hypothetical protein